MENKKKIFYVVNVDWFFLSHRLSLALEMLRKGYDVYILTKNTGKQNIIQSHGLKFINIDFERSGKNPLKEVKLVTKLFLIYRKYRPDIIHHVTIKPSIYGSIASKGLNNVIIINAVSGLGYNFIDGRDGIVQKTLNRLMKFAFIKRNLNFIFQNPDDMLLYQSRGFIKTNNYRIIKGAGVDAEKYPYTLPTDKSVIEIVVTARMLYDKGIREFIEASKILFDHWNGKAKFYLVGDTDLHNLAGIPKADILNSLIEGYLEWFGHIEDVREILKQADIVCLPSYREGLPKSLIEAMAIGRPIVTTDVPGCRECVDEGMNGVLVPAKDGKQLAFALEKLMNDKALRIKMGIASREKFLREMSLQQVLSETIQLYNFAF